MAMTMGPLLCMVLLLNPCLLDEQSDTWFPMEVLLAGVLFVALRASDMQHVQAG